MQPWKPLLAIVPAGLVLGLLAGQATRPQMLMKDERSWPQSVRENVLETEPWRPIYEGGPQDLQPSGYSYRPDLDYDIYTWPDQTDRSAELLAGDYDFGADRPGHELTMPQTRRAVAELAARQAERVAVEVGTSAALGIAAAEPPQGERESVVLPPLPPPLARSEGVPVPVEQIGTEAF